MAKAKNHNHPLIPLKKCVQCGEISVITHSQNGETWCSKCGSYGKVGKNG